MKRASLLSLVALAALVAVAVGACSPSPKALVDDFVKLVPEDVGPWEYDDGDTVRLGNNTVANTGHATLTFEGPDDAIAFVVVEAHPSEDAAEVAALGREREFLLQGLALDSDRVPRMATATITQTERVRYALFQEGSVTVEIDTLAAEGEAPVSDEDFGALLQLVRDILAAVVED